MAKTIRELLGLSPREFFRQREVRSALRQNVPVGSTETTVYQRKTTLTNDQIKALPTTMVELVPAPGAGKMLLFYRAVLVWHTEGGAYSNFDFNNAIMVAYEDWVLNCSSISDIPQGTSFYQRLLSPIMHNSLNPNYTNLVDGVYGSVSGDNSLENRNLSIAMDNQSAGDLTGGHADNTLEVTVFYSIVEL